MLKRLEITQPSSDLIEFMNIGWFCFSLEGEIMGANSVIVNSLPIRTLQHFVWPMPGVYSQNPQLVHIFTTA